MKLFTQHSDGGNNMSYHHLSTFERGRIEELLSLWQLLLSFWLFIV